MLEEPLLTERLALRRLEPADAVRINQLVGDWEVSRMLAAVPHPFDEAMAKDWIDRVRGQHKAGAAYHFAIERSEDGLLIGGIGLERMAAADTAELGYWLGKAYWRQGYASEAAGRIVRFGFFDLGLERMISAPLPTNSASIGILEKLGFTYQRREEQLFAARGEKREVSLYEMTRQAFAEIFRD